MAQQRSLPGMGHLPPPRDYHMPRLSRHNLPKPPSCVAYEARSCAFLGCKALPLFGYGPPQRREEVWTCLQHRLEAA